MAIPANSHDLEDTNRIRRLEGARFLAGLAAAPVGAVASGLLAYNALADTGMTPKGVRIDSLDAALSLGTGITFVAVGMTAIAVPIITWLTSRGPVTFLLALASGTALGLVPALLMVLAGRANQGALMDDVSRAWFLLPIALGLACGCGGAAMFWVVAVDGTRMHRGEPTFLRW